AGPAKGGRVVGSGPSLAFASVTTRLLPPQIAGGVFGWLEGPDPRQPIGDCVVVCGWAFAVDDSIQSITVKVNGADTPARYGLRRPDVAAAYPAHAGASKSGFTAYLQNIESRGTGCRLEVWAYRSDGSALPLFDVRLRTGNRQWLFGLVRSPT